MSPRAFVALLVVTVIVAVAAAWITVARDTGTGVRGEGTLMFEGLAGRVNDVRRIVVTRADGPSTIESAEKDGELSWSLKELYGYPVPFEMVRGVAAGMAQLRAIEPKTARPALYGRIHVNDPRREKDAKGALVELYDSKGASMASLIVGLDKGGLFGVGDIYVRHPGEERAWLARGKVPVPEKRVGWLNQMIVEVDLPRVRETTLYVPGEEPLRVYKNNPDERDFLVEGMPEDHELKEIFAAEDIARSIQSLAFEDVRPGAEIGFDFSATPRARYVTFDGLVVETWMKESGGKKWIAVRARANDEPAPVDKVDKDKVAAEIARINAVTGGWAYTINEFETKNLSKTRADVIRPKGAGKPAPAKPDGGAAPE
jgi:hypothetical protein